MFHVEQRTWEKVLWWVKPAGCWLRPALFLPAERTFLSGSSPFTHRSSVSTGELFHVEHLTPIRARSGGGRKLVLCAQKCLFIGFVHCSTWNNAGGKFCILLAEKDWMMVGKQTFPTS